MKKLRAVFVDDDPFIHEVVKDLVKNLATVELADSFCCPKKFIQNLQQQNYDLFLLDIAIPEIDGFALARTLKDKFIIFVTGEVRFLKDALSFSPIDILTKPLSAERFQSAIDKAVILWKYNNLQPEYKVFQCAQPKGKANIKLSEIIYVKGSILNYRQKLIVLKDNREYTLSHCTFEELLSISNKLVQVNKTELVSIDAVDTYEHDCLTLNFIKSRRPISINRVFRESFFKRMLEIHLPFAAV